MEKDKAEPLQFTLERRRHPRFLVEPPIEYRRANDSRIRPGHTVNFSEDGLMVSVSEQMEIGEQLEMKIYFSSGSSLITIAAIVKIAWVDMEAKEDGYYRFGVSFVNISPVDRERLKEFSKPVRGPQPGFCRIEVPQPKAPPIRVGHLTPSAQGLAPAKTSALSPLKKLLDFSKWAIGRGKPNRSVKTKGKKETGAHSLNAAA